MTYRYQVIFLRQIDNCSSVDASRFGILRTGTGAARGPFLALQKMQVLQVAAEKIVSSRYSGNPASRKASPRAEASSGAQFTPAN
ncbi:hypothetical protein [Rhizobium leguminosarum]|uniref:hypothetical protein n=1 Tax=Rhizobium leguminosarum TaxID=384 RepID=UPI001952D492|nr:hypothetical protein [Rhizobium leguminosarum]